MNNILQIQDMPTQLSEIGRIKLGRKGKMITSKAGNQFQPPQKLNGFLVTTNERDADGNFIPDEAIMKKLGTDPKEIPIYLLFDDIELNLQTRYVMYQGKRLVCKGDGLNWWYIQDDGIWKQGERPAKQLDPKYKGKDRCKATGVLSCVLADAEVVGGVWKFRTAGILSVQAMLSSLKLISYLTGGYLAGIPLSLLATPAQKTDEEGNTMKYMVVTVIFKGAPALLRERGLQMLTAGETYHKKLKEITTRAKVELAIKPNAFDEDVDDTIEEFFPEVASENVRKENETNIINNIVNNASEPKSEPTVFISEAKTVTPEMLEMLSKRLDKVAEKAGAVENAEQAEFTEEKKEEVKPEETKTEEPVKKPPKTPRKPKATTETIESTTEEPKGQETPKNDVISTPAVQTSGIVEDAPQKTNLPPAEHLKVLLIEAGLNSDDLRHTFYKKYPMAPEDYIKNMELFKTNLDLFKKKLILSLKQNVPSMIEQLGLGKVETSNLNDYYAKIDKDDFKEMMSFYADLKRSK